MLMAKQLFDLEHEPKKLFVTIHDTPQPESIQVRWSEEICQVVYRDGKRWIDRGSYIALDEFVRDFAGDDPAWITVQEPA